ncbi:hypothetical protein RsS62_51480 [Rhizobium dioscoreae]|nr:hypothetical protein RsS62_51480 [Rhizobium dioscoreae]
MKERQYLAALDSFDHAAKRGHNGRTVIDYEDAHSYPAERPRYARGSTHDFGWKIVGGLSHERAASQ